MPALEYSASLMSQSFWFLEFKMAVRLRSKGLSLDDIKKKCVEENLFGAAKEYRALRMAGYIVNRVKAMDDKLINLFCNSDLATQKLINLLVILRTDRMFFEFLYEVYREKVIIGVNTLNETDVNVFFTKKESQSTIVAGWKETTRKHLKSNYINYMVDANLLSINGKEKTITPPVLDVALERYLLAVGEDHYIKAITGGR